jgi:hypothetical protein
MFGSRGSERAAAQDRLILNHRSVKVFMDQTGEGKNRAAS